MLYKVDFFAEPALNGVNVPTYGSKAKIFFFSDV